jgi:L-asparaginase / beta-aspartyl-peptidase
MSEPTYSLVLHGGAGDSYSDAGRAALEGVLEYGVRLLASGAGAVDVVTGCVARLEDEPSLNAGRGSALNRDGDIEMDAGIMDGRDLSAGAVAGVRLVRNPVHAARAVMESSSHVLLIGGGAEEFARSHNLVMETPGYFRTPARVAAWEHGTVGAAARDAAGNLAAATSTGGIDGKLPGRVGDTPIVGAGVYADNRTCAVSATGVGEDAMRTLLAHRVAVLIEEHGWSAQAAAQAAVSYMVERVDGRAGVIVVDAAGTVGTAHSTPAMLSGSFVSDR